MNRRTHRSVQTSHQYGRASIELIVNRIRIRKVFTTKVISIVFAFDLIRYELTNTTFCVTQQIDGGETIIRDS